MNPKNNMKDFNEKLNTELANTRLTLQEKAAIRTRLHAHMSAYPAVEMPSAAPAKKPSPYFLYSFQFTSVARYAFAAFFLVIFLGGGTVSAAYGALPGDVLYPVKIAVNEQVEQALAQGDAKKASVHAKLAERRLEEAETLASRGELDAETSAEIEKNFDAHLQNVDSFAQALEVEDPGTAAEVAVEFDSSLEVHGAILARLGKDSDDDDTKEHSSRFSARLLARGNSWSRYATASSARGEMLATQAEDAAPEAATLSLQITAVTEDTSVPADTRQEKIALQLQKRAAEALKEAHESYSDVEKNLSTTTALRMKEQFDAAEVHMKEGDDALAQSKYGSAIESFTSAFRTAVQLDEFLDAQERLKQSFISSKFNWDSGTDFHDDEDNSNSNDDEDDNEDDSDEEDDSNDDKKSDGFWGSNFFNR